MMSALSSLAGSHVVFIPAVPPVTVNLTFYPYKNFPFSETAVLSVMAKLALWQFSFAMYNSIQIFENLNWFYLVLFYLSICARKQFGAIKLVISKLTYIIIRILSTSPFSTMQRAVCPLKYSHGVGLLCLRMVISPAPSWFMQIFLSISFGFALLAQVDTMVLQNRYSNLEGHG